MANIKVTVGIACEKGQTDLSKCTYCDEVIFGTMTTVFLEVDGNITATEIRVCESCIDILK